MINNPDGLLHIYVVNVGQGDTTIIVSPQGTVTVIDAQRPDKLERFLTAELGLDGTIEHLIITHPHADHFNGANRLASSFAVTRATFAPSWHEFGLGPPTYQGLVSALEASGTIINFLSGYSRWYPDNLLVVPAGATSPVVDEDALYIELLGPTNALIRSLEGAQHFNTNHLSIMARVNWQSARMIIAADAQMENWAFFREEGLMEENCQVLRSAHHGSKNGTQWELIDRIDPAYVIISSDPDGRHHIPDLVGSGIFTDFNNPNNRRSVVMTSDSGTIHLQSTNGRRFTLEFGAEGVNDPVDLSQMTRLTHNSNPTNIFDLLNTRIAEI
ncbi:MAG: MBL fold metallo-hydrolase [Saprospiraceae bacterium]|nr:MBL fold metallo-hydrolase [Saprospiraceae bacterium]